MTALPVRIISLALFKPIIFTNLNVPPSIKGTPKRLQKTPKVASLWLTIRSHQQASSKPPATAKSYIAPMTGLESWSLLGPIGAGFLNSFQLSIVFYKDLFCYETN